MARQVDTPIQLDGPYPADLELTAVTWTAIDNVNGDEVVLTGQEILLFRNDNASSRTITITSVAGAEKRTGDLTLALSQNEYAAFQATKLSGWLQSDGKLYFTSSGSDTYVAILKLK